MAWTAPKTWTGGERLYASDLNTYVSENLADLDPRTVKTFADASARTSGITSPTEGMLSYLADTDAVEVYDGSAWTSVGPSQVGKVLQVVSAFSATNQSLTGSTYVTLTGCQPTITPSSATSKILLIYSAYLETSTGGNAGMRVYRDATQIADQYSAGGRTAGESDMATIVFLDTPATTSAITYTIKGNTGNASQTYTWDTQSYTLLEVAG